MAWHAAAEWRVWAIPRGWAITDTVRFERFGFALFGELGSVAERVSEFDEARLLNVAHRYQQVTDWHKSMPKGFE